MKLVKLIIIICYAIVCYAIVNIAFAIAEWEGK